MKWISYFVVFAAGLSVTVSALKVSGYDEFKVGQIDFPLSRFVYVVLALTGVHAFLTWVFLQRAVVIEALGKSTANLAWGKLTHSEAFIFFNMRPRVLSHAPWPVKQVYIAETADTAFWLTAAFAVALIVALVMTLNSDKPKIVRSDRGFYSLPLNPFIGWFNHIAIGCALAGVNWWIGSQWAIAASKLAPTG
jgi:hypothetical protein